MTDRWLLIERTVQQALACGAGAWPAFLDDACAGDEELRREVESLLAYEDTAQGFLESPALEEAARALAEHSDAPVVGREIGGYRIEALVGSGGMGDVYRARDLKLGRDVALKLLERSPDLRIEFDRFEEEARLASILNHPNIVTIHGVGADGTSGYIAMELVHGRTLRALLADGALSTGVMFDLAVQLADALAAADKAGIVHRDLKPDNVMVTADGLVKVLDFGIAKRSAAGSLPVAGDRSGVIGTAGYMSPEQAEGRPVGTVSDQFSFGVILYEMLSGRRPFDRTSKAETIAAIIHDPAPPIADLPAGVAKALRGVLDTCLSKRSEGRYASMQELALTLRAIRERWVHPDLLSRRRALWLGSAAAAAIVAGVGTWTLWPRSANIRSLAVLPFINTAHDDETEHLCDGLTSTLIRRIALLPSLTVMSRSLVFNFKGKMDDPCAVGRQLGVDAVLTGAVVRRSGRLQITTELADVTSGRSIWSASYDRDLADLLFVEDEIARAIVDEGIRLRISGDDRRRLVQHPTSDAAAYEHYLRAVHLSEQENEAGYLQARELLAEAIARDPKFIDAYIAQAATYAIMAVDGLERPTEAWPQSSRNVRRALDLDPDMPDAHGSAAAIEFFFNWHWEAAESEWRLALNAGAANVHPDLLAAHALQRWALGHAEEALYIIRLIRARDKLTPMFTVREADYLLHAGRLEAAASGYTDAIRSNPADPRAYFGLAEVRRAQGRYADAIDARKRGHETANDDLIDAALADAHGPDGYRSIERAAARQQLSILSNRLALRAYVSPLDFARAHAVLGEADHAFAYFEPAFTDRAPGLVFLNVDRSWDSIRADPRFQMARTLVGLP